MTRGMVREGERPVGGSGEVRVRHLVLNPSEAC